MPCSATPRGFTDTKLPWSDVINNNPCGVPIVTMVGGVDVSAQNLCLPHYTMKYGQGAVPGPTPGIDAYTVFCFHADSFTEVQGHPLAASGDAQISTAQSKFGGNALLLDGTGDYLSTPDSPDWAFGSGDFTLECWAYFTNVAVSTQTLIAQFSGSPGQYSWILRWDVGFLKLYYSPDGTTLPANLAWAWTPVVNTWYHIAVVRTGNNVLAFINGGQIGTAQPISGALFDSNATLAIGASSSGSWNFYGYLDEIRISKGIARWTANFTPPTTPYS